MMIKGYEDVHSQLLTENDLLRDRVSRINSELNEILQTRKDFLIKTRKIEMGEEFTEDFDLNYSNMMNFKKELLNMPMDSVKNREISSKFSMNLSISIYFFFRSGKKHWIFCKRILRDSRIL